MNYYNLKGRADSKLRKKIELLKNNKNIKLFTANGWKVELLISISPLKKIFFVQLKPNPGSENVFHGQVVWTYFCLIEVMLVKKIAYYDDSL